MRSALLFVTAVVLAGCSHTGHLAVSETHTKTKLTVTSPAFTSGQPIPKEFTADGRNVNPPLQWTPGPAGTKQYVIIVEDPDVKQSPPFVHWIVADLSPSVTSLTPGVEIPGAAVSAAFTGNPADARPAASQLKNSKNLNQYVGPEPPPNQLHHYHFEVFALDHPLNLPRTAEKTAVENAMRGHVLAEGELVGTYERAGRK